MLELDSLKFLRVIVLSRLKSPEAVLWARMKCFVIAHSF